MSADHHLHSTQEQPPDHKTFAGRVTFGFLTANIHIGAGRTVWPGVVDAAEKHGVNLICFPGGELRMSAGFEAQRNVIYDLIDARRLNGLVTWASTLGGALSPSEVTNFHQRFEPLPMVSLAQVMEKVPTLSIDSYEGMRAAVTHLIEVHGYQRLAFIRGPASHVYAQERYHAYTDVLQDYGLPFLRNW